MSGMTKEGENLSRQGNAAMAFFTWHERGLSEDCQSLEAMAARFEEAARLMRRLAAEGFRVERVCNQQRITHPDAALFTDFGFIDEGGPHRQLVLVQES